MKFKQPPMHNGEPNPGRWWSDCHVYAISKYEYYPNSRGQYEPCDEWYAAYKYPEGRRVTPNLAKLSFDEAVAYIEEDKKI